jgi:hypothetical protein
VRSSTRLAQCLGSFPGGRLSITGVGLGFGACTRIVNGGGGTKSSNGTAFGPSTGSESVAVADAVSVAEADAVSDVEAVVWKSAKSFSYEAEKGGKGDDATGTKVGN